MLILFYGICTSVEGIMYNTMLIVGNVLQWRQESLQGAGKAQVDFPVGLWTYLVQCGDPLAGIHDRDSGAAERRPPAKAGT